MGIMRRVRLTQRTRGVCVGYELRKGEKQEGGTRSREFCVADATRSLDVKLLITDNR